MNKYSLIVIFTCFLLTSCLEIETFTQINADGSIKRKITLEGLADGIQATRFNIPRHDLHLWQVSSDSIDPQKILYSAQRTFESIDALNQSFLKDNGDLKVNIKSELDVSNWLIFTSYKYTEKIWADLPGPQVPMDSYLSSDDLSKLFINKNLAEESRMDSAETQRIENALVSYLEYRAFSDFILELRVGARSVGIEDLLDETLKLMSDSIFVQLKESNYYDTNSEWIEVLGETFDDSTLVNIERENSHGFKSFQNRWDFVEEMSLNNHSFNVALPGVVRETNSNQLSGSSLEWNPDPLQFFFEGVELRAESREFNELTAVIIGLIVFFGLAIMLVWILRRRVMGQP